MFELIMKNIEQHQEVPYLYDLLLNVIQTIEETTDFHVVKLNTLFFELKLLHFIGVAPVMSNCVECGSTENIANFDISRGGFVCQNCINPTSRFFSIDALQTLYQLYHQDFETIDYSVTDNVLQDLRILLNDYFSYHLGMKTNSSKYFT